MNKEDIILIILVSLILCPLFIIIFVTIDYEKNTSEMEKCMNQYKSYLYCKEKVGIENE